MAVLISEIFAFLIIVFVLYRYVWPILSGMATKQQDAIQQKVDESEEAARKLELGQRRFDSALAEARDEVAKIRDTARADAERIQEELREQADREVERIRQRGEEQLVAQRDQTKRQLQTEIGGLLMQLTERIIDESLSDDKGKRSTVDRFLDELEQMGGSGTDPRDSHDPEIVGERQPASAERRA
ncbi:MAG: F0F1 ATP synthase subunit B [Geodermatophilaceae bacterium]|nr:F0F1 ATP synthase subunit B [Geodermatophilaceae bacterium]